jgi:hypothetical protein
MQTALNNLNAKSQEARNRFNTLSEQKEQLKKDEAGIFDELLGSPSNKDLGPFLPGFVQYLEEFRSTSVICCSECKAHASVLQACDACVNKTYVCLKCSQLHEMPHDEKRYQRLCADCVQKLQVGVYCSTWFCTECTAPREPSMWEAERKFKAAFSQKICVRNGSMMPIVDLYFTAPHPNWSSSEKAKEMIELSKQLKIDVHW